MTDKLLKYFSRITTLSDEESRAIIDSCTLREFRKNSFLLKEGQLFGDTYLILKGCVRQYGSMGGEEKTIAFFTENQWLIPLTGFAPPSPSLYSLVSVEDTAVVVGNEQKAQELFRKFPRFESISRSIIENAYAEQQKQMIAYLTDTPEQRYLRLLNGGSDILQRVPQYQIASYIGVKPESLSRIRKRIIAKQ